MWGDVAEQCKVDNKRNERGNVDEDNGRPNQQKKGSVVRELCILRQPVT